MILIPATSICPGPAELAEIAQLALILDRADIAEIVLDAAYDVVNGLPYQAIYDLMVELRQAARRGHNRPDLTDHQISLLHLQPRR